MSHCPLSFGSLGALATLRDDSYKRACRKCLAHIAALIWSPAHRNSARRGDARSANITLCILLGVERTSPTLFENCLEVLLQQIQIAAFGLKVSSTSRPGNIERHILPNHEKS